MTARRKWNHRGWSGAGRLPQAMPLPRALDREALRMPLAESRVKAEGIVLDFPDADIVL